MLRNKKLGLPRWRCLCAYDGTNYVGWQRQKSGDSVQGVIEDALAKAIGDGIRTVGAGRTDAGVHAEGQVFHFDAVWNHGPEKMLKALLRHLPQDIQLLKIREVSPSFHALHSAKGKHYIYRAIEGRALPMETNFFHSLKNLRPDLELMRAGAVHLLGRHNFSAFAASRGHDDNENPEKENWRLEVKKSGPRIGITAVGGGFLYKMVRSIAGALFDVGTGKLEPDDIREILESCKRTHLIITAPARGLTLVKVHYQRPRR